MEFLGSAAPLPRPPAPTRVRAGPTAADALKEAGVPLKGPDGAVVVRNLATGDLKDLAWTPDADASVQPAPAATPRRPRGRGGGRGRRRPRGGRGGGGGGGGLPPGPGGGRAPPIENG